MTSLDIVRALTLSAILLGCNRTSPPSQPDPAAVPVPAPVTAIGTYESLSAGLTRLAQDLDAPPGQPASLAALAEVSSWRQPTSHSRIVGPIHFVGTRGLGVYLITTEGGHIMLDGGLPSSASDIEASIRKFKHKPQDIAFLLLTHAHIDHAGTVAHFKKLAPAAKVVVMDRDAEILESGGRSDPVYGRFRLLRYPAVRPDRVLKDGDTVSLGGITMTARKTAGHSPGCTTWITTVHDGGKSYKVVFPGSSNVNPGMRLFVNPSWPGIADDFRSTFQVLESLKPDIWLSAHTSRFAFESKRSRVAQVGVAAWVDPDGYSEYVSTDKAKFEELLAKEKAESRRRH